MISLWELKITRRKVCTYLRNKKYIQCMQKRLQFFWRVSLSGEPGQGPTRDILSSWTGLGTTTFGHIVKIVACWVQKCIFGMISNSFELVKIPKKGLQEKMRIQLYLNHNKEWSKWIRIHLHKKEVGYLLVHQVESLVHPWGEEGNY